MPMRHEHHAGDESERAAECPRHGNRIALPSGLAVSSSRRIDSGVGGVVGVHASFMANKHNNVTVFFIGAATLATGVTVTAGLLYATGTIAKALGLCVVDACDAPTILAGFLAVSATIMVLIFAFFILGTLFYIFMGAGEITLSLLYKGIGRESEKP